MSIVVTGATGQLGRLVVDRLPAEIPADRVAAVVRDADKAADAFLAVLTGAGLPGPVAEIFADVDVNGVSRGLLQGGGDDLARLIGRPTTPLADTIAAALKG